MMKNSMVLLTPSSKVIVSAHERKSFVTDGADVESVLVFSIS